ncbi:META domain-containing protein [Pontibacter sp. CAU 1760]
MKMLSDKFYTALLLLFIMVGTACTMQPRRGDTAGDTIQDAYWVLLSLEGKEVEMQNDMKTAYLRLEENENDVSGFTGCNRLLGNYTLSGTQLSFSKLRSTRMACPDMATENKLLEVLGQVTAYNITGDLLTLYNGQQVVATLKTGNPELMQQEIEDRPSIKIVD